VIHADTPLRIRRLRRAELPTDTEALARFLIGKIVVRELPSARLSGRIVETEAYPIGDPAAHHYIGPTPRNRSMFLRRGHAYIYFSYGNHFMLNISAEVPEIGGGVLIRALEPLEGVPQMQAHRGTTKLTDLTRGPGRLAAALKIDRTLDGVDLCAPGPLWLGTLRRTAAPATPRRPAGHSGPATHRKFAPGVTRDASRRRATDSQLASSAAQTPSPQSASSSAPAAARPAKIIIRQSIRIGITRAAHRLLRFYEKGNPFVSGPARLRS
jgi:DNA-3-methyladenine glycosylase